ncbi:hydrogen peroxide-inducible genes activator [Marinicella gelatinilytica]|uniref:hydrogen peroxide-inducible genes activator n=1 Tax=Marinicella gelatinilytica TaxID=2996017 RepID=UPI002260CC26|nr:hydrogen peroxide-inducible genes activator [Marinicella gelatinilytica]MCX7544043.1 LysR substrate-binding domain-containing protein [Marinicella gelatinilytica]
MHYPTIKQLRYFNALVAHNHFGQAAESCFVSQSAFSVAIKELERTLGGQLVDRTNKRVTITNLGREVHSQSQAVIAELQKLTDLAQGNLKPLSGRLSIGMIPTIGPFVMPSLLPHLKSNYPQLELEIHEGKTADIYDLLMEGRLDVLLLALPYELRSVETLSLFKDPFRLIYGQQSSHTKRQQFNINQLEDGSVLLLDDGHCLRDHAISACHIQHVDKVSHFTASSLLTLIAMVRQNLGVSFIPEMAVHSNLIGDDIVVKAMDKKAYREVGLAWRKGSTRSKEFKLLGQGILQSCQVPQSDVLV